MDIHWGFLVLFAWIFIGSILTNFLWGWKYSKARTYHIFKGVLVGMLIGPISFFFIKVRKR